MSSVCPKTRSIQMSLNNYTMWVRDGTVTADWWYRAREAEKLDTSRNGIHLYLCHINAFKRHPTDGHRPLFPCPTWVGVTRLNPAHCPTEGWYTTYQPSMEQYSVNIYIVKIWGHEVSAPSHSPPLKRWRNIRKFLQAPIKYL